MEVIIRLNDYIGSIILNNFKARLEMTKNGNNLENYSQKRLIKIDKPIQHNLYRNIKKYTKDFFETISHGMIGFVVSKEKYPDGYHANPELCYLF